MKIQKIFNQSGSRRKFALVSVLLIISFQFPDILSGQEERIKKNEQQSAVKWKQWQYTLTSQKSPDRQQVSIDVVFSGSGGRTFHSHAFSDDGKTFCFRAAFPSTGTWRWKTICSDPGDTGLHNKEGKVKVKAYNGDNPLYKHGDLRVSEDKRYLVHADGTPFLWMGETGWRSTQESTIPEWYDYIDTRTTQRFSVVQISPRGVSKKPETELEAVSFKADGRTDPLFWQELEDKITYANEKGLFVFMVGTGKSWSDHIAKNPENQTFETYITGRFAGLMVIFSPSFDQLYDTGNDSVGAELNKLTLHLVTQHPGTNYEANLKYRNIPSADFCGLQSGHHGGNLARVYNAARSWTLDMWNGVPVKPVINIEAMYDGYGNDDAKNWREKDARKLGWITWLSGSRGYTYGAGSVPPKVPIGAGGVWRFNQDSSAYDYWRKAIKWPSAGQMTIMHDFFESIEWWRLVPVHELIKNQPVDETLKMVVSITREEELLIAYLPDNPVIELDLKDFSVPLKEQWFNPVTGKYISIDSPVIPAPGVTFSRPEEWEDAILLLRIQGK